MAEDYGSSNLEIQYSFYTEMFQQLFFNGWDSGKVRPQKYQLIAVVQESILVSQKQLEMEIPILLFNSVMDKREYTV